MRAMDTAPRGPAWAAMDHAGAVLAMVIGAAVVPHLLAQLLNGLALGAGGPLAAMMGTGSLIAAASTLVDAVATAILAGLAALCLVLAMLYARPRGGPRNRGCAAIYAVGAAASVIGLFAL